MRKQFSTRLQCEITYGNITTVRRKALGLPKNHGNDAVAITGTTKISRTENDVFLIRQVRRNKRSLHEATAHKGRTETNREARRNKKNTVHQKEFFLNDKVMLFGQLGFVSSFCQGGLYVIDPNGNYITKPGKTYKQIGFGDVTRLYHSGNWLYTQRSEEREVIYGLSFS